MDSSSTSQTNMQNISTLGPVELFVQGILYGLYLCSSGHCIRWLLFKDEGWKLRALKEINRVMFSITVYLFLASTILFVNIAINNFLNRRSEIPSLLWFDTLANDLIWMSILLIADAVLIFRCWTIFSKSWRVISLPLAAWCACIICNILYVYCNIRSLLVSNVHAPGICSSTSFPLVFYSCNIFVNVYATAAIVYRILNAFNSMTISTGPLLRVVHIIMDSGVLYTLSSVLFLAGLINDSISAKAGQHFAIPVFTAVVYPLNIFMPPIAFNLILIHVGEQRAKAGIIYVNAGNASTLSGTLRFRSTADSQDGSSI